MTDDLCYECDGSGWIPYAKWCGDPECCDWAYPCHCNPDPD